MLWLAWVAANMCVWMNDVTAAWLMATLSADPKFVALVQTASALPMFLLALPSGAWADIIDRRRWFMGTQLWVACAALLLAGAAAAGLLTPSILLLLVFVNGIGLAMRWPVFAAIVPEVVPRNEVPQAVALNSVAANMSRTLGPTLAGLILASLGGQFVFALNAALSLATVIVIFRWKSKPKASALPGERLLGALRVGLQFVAQSPALKMILLRTFLFFLQGAATMSLMPLIAKTWNGGVGTYALLMSCLGAGAVTAGLLLQRLHPKLDRHVLINGGSVINAVSVICAVLAPNPILAAAAMFPAGITWTGVANSLNVSAQIALPDWMRARGMAIFLMSVTAGNALGAATWGLVASHAGVRGAVLLSSMLALFVTLALRRRMPAAIDDDLTPIAMQAHDESGEMIDPHAGPVVTVIEYIVDAEDDLAFAAVMEDSRRARLRGGALSWGLLRDASDPRRQLEYYVEATWLEHRRRIDRLTVGDVRLRERRLALHRGAGAPRLRRYVSRIVIR